MSESFKEGLVKGLLVWLIGFVITAITHTVVGWDYAHAPPASAIVVLMTMIVGIFRLVKSASDYIRDKEKAKNRGEIIIHISFFALIILAILVLALK